VLWHPLGDVQRPVEVLPAANQADAGDALLQGMPDSLADEQQRADVLGLVELSCNQGQDLGDLGVGAGDGEAGAAGEVRPAVA
jgi:hypothetical protein